jgi:hypothetical protein
MQELEANCNRKIIKTARKIEALKRKGASPLYPGLLPTLRPF